jgi:hypothetical protein
MPSARIHVLDSSDEEECNEVKEFEEDNLH